MSKETPTTFEMIAKAMEHVSEEAWKQIFDATRDRLLHTEFRGEDTPSNRVSCDCMVSYALFDIRDAYDRLKKTND